MIEETQRCQRHSSRESVEMDRPRIAGTDAGPGNEKGTKPAAQRPRFVPFPEPYVPTPLFSPCSLLPKG